MFKLNIINYGSWYQAWYMIPVGQLLTYWYLNFYAFALFSATWLHNFSFRRLKGSGWFLECQNGLLNALCRVLNTSVFFTALYLRSSVLQKRIFRTLGSKIKGVSAWATSRAFLLGRCTPDEAASLSLPNDIDDSQNSIIVLSHIYTPSLSPDPIGDNKTFHTCPFVISRVHHAFIALIDSGCLLRKVKTTTVPGLFTCERRVGKSRLFSLPNT